jgi:hypothetical protein
MGTGGESFHPNPRDMTQLLATMTTPAAMAVRSIRLANAKEDAGDMAGMLRCCQRTSLFMALPDFDYDEFVSLGGLA